MPRGWHVRRFHELVDYRLCSGPRRRTAMPQGWHGQRFYEPDGHRLYYCLRRRTSMPWGCQGQRFKRGLMRFGQFLFPNNESTFTPIYI